MSDQDKFEKDLLELMKKHGGGMKTINIVQKIGLQEQQATEHKEIQKYIDDVKSLAEERGLSFSSILKIVVKIPKIMIYRHPETGKEWHGNGKPIKWVQAWLEEKGNLDACIIDKSREIPPLQWPPKEKTAKAEAKKSEPKTADQKQSNPIKQKA